MVWDEIFRSQLADRRQRLEAAIATSHDSGRLVSLLQEVDATLERIGTPQFGLCVHCRQPVEAARLLANPMVRTCLECLSAEEQRALEADLEMAGRIQQGLLPKGGKFDGWDVGLHYWPAGPVSGDYCDLIPDSHEPGSLYFLLGDVSGKGVSASLLMAHLHAMFRSFIAMGLPVDRLVQQANHVFCESTISTHFATLACGRARPSGEIELCNAGHCPPLVVRGRTVTALEVTGLPIGIFCTGEYSVVRAQLAPGEVLVLYSDGLSEAHDASGAEYGAGRLACLLTANGVATAQDLVSACLQDLRGFLGPRRPSDDLTLLVLRRA